ncbi:MAG: T9SS type A sorting domain-containing protein [Rhodothermales bacterium]|nr:T9SS type A sorting domain-containing protein [Rhodothermales bacterium]
MSTDLNGDGIGDADRLVFAKYDHGGVLQWAVSGAGPAGIDMTGLAVGQSGTVTISGSYLGSVDLDGDGMTDGSSPRNSFELLVSKFSTVEITGIEQNSTADIPFDDILGQNYPNPFRPVTRIRFQTRSSGHARLTVFDVLGREVTTLVDAHLDGSVHDVTWDASGMPAGLYVYRITTDSFSATRTMVLLK